MTDFSDHFEDMDEEIGEFREDLRERLEENFGFEVKINQVRQETQYDRYYIEVEPVGIEETLSDELGSEVTSGSPLSFYVAR